ncbi:MAG: hypothetical protein AAAFM81_00680 [Pseudomonadota bacterium]
MNWNARKTKVLLIAIVVWLTPALIAGAAGCRGVWGSGSALFDYLLPLPVSGGVLHVPSFAVFLAMYLMARDGTVLARWVAILAFAVALGALAAMVDAERLNAVLFTDYAPAGSAIRFSKNPFLLFVLTDAFWLGVLTIGLSRAPIAAWSITVLSPLLVLATGVIGYVTGGPVLEPIAGQSGERRGQEQVLIYTNQPYDEQRFLDSLAAAGVLMPWESANAEHTQFVFTASRQQTARRDYQGITEEKTVATICAYEEDRSLAAYAGLHPCFADRPVFVERLNRRIAEQPQWMAKDVAAWHAGASLCRGVDMTIDATMSIARNDHCRRQRRRTSQAILAMKRNYGRDSRAVRLTQRVARELGWEQ